MGWDGMGWDRIGLGKEGNEQPVSLTRARRSSLASSAICRISTSGSEMQFINPSPSNHKPKQNPVWGWGCEGVRGEGEGAGKGVGVGVRVRVGVGVRVRVRVRV